MTGGGRISIAVLLGLLAFAGAIWGRDALEYSETSFGSSPVGQGALFDVLLEAGHPVERSYAAPELLPPKTTVWWIAPDDLCPKLGTTEVAPGRIRAPEWKLRRWLEQGGTALLFWPAHPVVCDGKPSLAGLELPRRAADRWLEEPLTEGTPGAKEPADRPPSFKPLALVQQSVSGTLTPTVRVLETYPLATFSETEEWRIAATLEGKPFVVEHSVGDGRIVLIADADFLRNRTFDRADAAPFVQDLVATYGVPRIDEREHGLQPGPGTLGYLAGSDAMPFALGVLALGLLFAWHGAALPRRSLQDSGAVAPKLEAYVASLADLYASTRDHPRVLDRYRELSEARIRRVLNLPPAAPREQLFGRLRATGPAGEEALRLLSSPAAVRGHADLERRVAALDAAVARLLR